MRYTTLYRGYQYTEQWIYDNCIDAIPVEGVPLPHVVTAYMGDVVTEVYKLLPGAVVWNPSVGEIAGPVDLDVDIESQWKDIVDRAVEAVCDRWDPKF